MEKKLSFNENADNYDRLRPRYCQELFADIAAYAGLQEGAAALEVGAGTGQATGPFLERGCQVTAIEPGAQLAGILNQKHRESAKLSVKNCLFEDFSAPSGSFDLIYAGTAFHWVPEEAGYPKAKKLLRPGGTLALFWNTPVIQNPESDAMQPAYQRFFPDESRPPQFPQERFDKREALMHKYGFSFVQRRYYYKERILTAKEYILLLDTYSDVRIMEPDRKEAFFQEIEEAILGCGGMVRIRDIMDLHLGKNL